VELAGNSLPKFVWPDGLRSRSVPDDCIVTAVSTVKVLIMVEAAGVEPDIGVENAQLIHSRNARNLQISMSAKSAYKSRTNKS